MNYGNIGRFTPKWVAIKLQWDENLLDCKGVSRSYMNLYSKDHMTLALQI